MKQNSYKNLRSIRTDGAAFKLRPVLGAKMGERESSCFQLRQNRIPELCPDDCWSGCKSSALLRNAAWTLPQGSQVTGITEPFHTDHRTCIKELLHRDHRTVPYKTQTHPTGIRTGITEPYWSQTHPTRITDPSYSDHRTRVSEHRTVPSGSQTRPTGITEP